MNDEAAPLMNKESLFLSEIGGLRASRPTDGYSQKIPIRTKGRTCRRIPFSHLDLSVSTAQFSGVEGCLPRAHKLCIINKI